MVMRRAVYMSGKPGALDPDVMSDAEVMALYPDALKNKQIQDSVNSMSAEIEAKKQTLTDYQKLTKEQQADQLQTQSRYYETLNERISDVNSRIEELGKSGGVNAERAAATYNSVLESFVNRATGGNKAQFIADNFRNRKKNPPSEIEILMASGYYPAFESEVKNRQALEKANDPEVTKLLAEYQSLMVSRRDTEQKLTALNFDFSKAAPAGKPATAAAPAGTPKTTGTPAPAALKAAIDAARGGAQTTANPGSPPVEVQRNERIEDEEVVDGTGDFYRPPVSTPVPVSTSVPASASVSQPSPAPSSTSSGPTPAWWSVERDPEANQRAVIESVSNTVRGIPAFASRVAQAPIDLLIAAPKVLNAVPLGASFLGGRYTDPNNYVQGKQPPAYSKTPPPEQGMGATVYYDPQAEAKNRRYRDMRPSTPSEVMATGSFDTKMNTTLPDITTSGGSSGVSNFFSPAQDPLLANRPSAMGGSAKPMTFGESFAKRYNEVKNSNMTPNEKAKSLAALEQTRDLLVSRGFTYNSPDPTQAATVPPEQGFPFYFRPPAR